MGLVLTRKVDEKIFIGENIEITVVEIHFQRNGEKMVKLDINAPKEIPIYRAELLKEIKGGAARA